MLLAFDSKSPSFTSPRQRANDAAMTMPTHGPEPMSPMPEPVPPAVARFRSCRWPRPPENGLPECCGHRDVLPLAGTTGFNAGSWCPDCEYYKLRRTPKKREGGY